MARESTQKVVVTRKASGDIERSRIVFRSGSGEVEQVNPTDAANAAALRALIEDGAYIALQSAKDGAPVDVVIHGRTRVVANEAADEGEMFGVTAEGRATTVVPATHFALGRYLEAPSAQGQVVDCFLDGPREVTTPLA